VISPSQRPLPTQDNTTYKHKKQISVPSAGFEPVISVTKRPQTYALDRATTGISLNSRITDSNSRQAIRPNPIQRVIPNVNRIKNTRMCIKQTIFILVLLCVYYNVCPKKTDLGFLLTVLFFWVVTPCRLVGMFASSRRHNPEEHRHSYRHENLKPHIGLL
jgi:hypothetical protein